MAEAREEAGQPSPPGEVREQPVGAEPRGPSPPEQTDQLSEVLLGEDDRAPLSRSVQLCGHSHTLPRLVVIQGWPQKFMLSAGKILWSTFEGSPAPGDPGHDP